MKSMRAQIDLLKMECFELTKENKSLKQSAGTAWDLVSEVAFLVEHKRPIEEIHRSLHNITVTYRESGFID